MKKLFLTLLLLISALCIQAQTPYVLWCPDNTTLYFVADCSEFSYKVSDTFASNRITKVWSERDISIGVDFLGVEVQKNVTRVVFHWSFAYVKPTSTHMWFWCCRNLKDIVNLQYLNTSNVRDMSSMFYECTSLTSLDVSGFDTSNVTDMRAMFYNCSSLKNLDVSGFDTSNVTDMFAMFYDCSNLTSLDVSDWDTSKVTDMGSMFHRCYGLTSLDLSSWYTSKVIDMGAMFYNCFSLSTIYCYDTWSCSYSTDMFYGCISLKGGQGMNYSSSKTSVTYANPGPNGYFTLPVKAVWCKDDSKLFFIVNPKKYKAGDWVLCGNDGGRATKVWSGTVITNSGSIPAWNEEIRNAVTIIEFDEEFINVHIQTTRRWFEGCSNLKSIYGLQYLNTSNVTDMSYMFSGCYGLTSIDLSKFDTSRVTNMEGMFYGTHLTSLNLSNFDTSKVTNMQGLFMECWDLLTLDVSNFNTSNVTCMNGMFSRCECLKRIDLSGWDTSKVTDMSYMFLDCSSLTGLDLSNFNTPNVTNMGSMFHGCSSLKNLDVSHFDTSKVTDMNEMFYGCSNLKTIYCHDSWSCSNSPNMFYDCISLKGGQGMKYDANKTDATYANIGPNGYFTYIKLQQSITLTSIPSMTYGDASYTLPSKTNEGLTLTWSSDNTSVATISGTILTIKGAGSANIMATQAGNDSYKSFSKTFTLNVKKAVLTVTAQDCTKYRGEENPPFYLSYSGFKNNDTLSCLISLPVANTTANADSPVGNYLIWASGGEADNYSFNYLNGTLTIIPLPTDDIDLTSLVGTSQDDWHAQGTSSTSVPKVTTSDGRLVTMLQHFEENVEMQGKLMYQDIEGLENGEYEVKVYANAYYTPGRGFDSDIYSGQRDLAYVSANESHTYLSAHIGTSYLNSDVYTIYAHVTNGRLRIGLTVEKRGANWYTLQIKSLKLLKKGTVVYADAKSKVPGKSNPTLTYTVCSMTSYQGTPSLSCNATTSSPAGSYIIEVNTSNMSSSENIYAQPGVLTVVGSGQEMAIWCAGNSTLYFLKTTKTYLPGDTFNGQTVTNVWSGSEIIYSGDFPAWYDLRNETIQSTVTNVVFDLSFTSVKPTSLRRWFYEYQQLSTITGLEYLNTSSVTDMSSMFEGCSSLTSLNVSNFDTSNVTNMGSMFEGCSNLTCLDVSGWDTSYVTDMGSMFSDCSKLTFLDLSNFDTSNVTIMAGMFRKCYGLTSLDLSNFNTSKVTSMNNMFDGCIGLTSLDLSYFNTSKVTGMSNMFNSCYHLMGLDLSGWDTSNVTDMRYMFYQCFDLSTIYCNNSWLCSNSHYMFYSCSHLIGGQGMKYNDYCTDVTFANPGPNGYFTKKDSPQFTSNSCYIRNVATGKYFGPGNTWGTHASIIDEPVYNTLIKQEDGTYFMETLVNNGGNSYYLNGEWMDNDNPAHLTIETLPNGYHTIALDGNYYVATDNTVLMLTAVSDMETNSKAWWQFLTQAELDAENAATLAPATANNPVDASFLITDPGFGRNRRDAQSAWKPIGTNITIGGPLNDNVSNYSAESYHSNFSITQTIPNVPKGRYRLDVQGFYRQDGTDADHLPVFYMNDATVTFPILIGTENNMDEAGKSFSAGLYAATPIYIELDEPGTLTIGAHLNNNTNLWCIWDNFKLTYYGSGDSILGDINGDGDINVFDIVEMVDYIMNSQYVVSADIVSDGVVDVFDLVEEVSIVMQQTVSGKQRRIQRQNETNYENVLTLSDKGHNAISIGTTLNEGVIASQFILELSEGLQLKDITTDEAHHLSYTPLGNNRYLVISYSDANEAYMDNDELINLSLEGKGAVKVTDAMIVTSDRKPLHVQPTESEFTTDIIEVADKQNGLFNVYSTTGTLIRHNTSSYEGLPKGTYIINGKKTMIK